VSPPVQKKETVTIPEKAKPLAKLPVKAEPEKPKIEEKKSEPKKIEPKTEAQKVAQEEPKPAAQKPVLPPKPQAKQEEAKLNPEREKIKKVEEKKPEQQQVETKPQEPQVETKKEIKPEAAKSVVKAVEKNQEEKPTPSDVMPAEERDRQIAAALERIKTQVQPKGNSEFTEEAKGKGPITKGGPGDEGGGGVTRGIEFILYTQQIQRQVQESWIVTEKRPGLIAAVSFKIQPNGDIQEVELTQSSGDKAFDQSVVRAIRKAAPFLPPPQSYAQEFATQKIVMNFGGEGRVN